MNQIARVQQAIDYIEDNLRRELTTADIARRAAFSSWHFQRMFGAMVGEPLQAYVRRRRLARARAELGSTDRRILEIALDYGFQSQEAFTRAFKQQFGLTPGRCRRQGLALPSGNGKAVITREYLKRLYGGIDMQPTIVNLEEMKVVGLGTRFISILSPDRNNHVVIPELWDRYLKRMGEIANRLGRTDLGICSDLPAGPARRHEDEFYYMACAPVSSTARVPAGMESRTLPAGKYARFSHQGSLDGLQQTMNYIYGSWLPNSGYEHANSPDVEWYDERFKGNAPGSVLDIYIPIQ